MELELSESQALLRQSLRALLDGELDFARVREVERSGGFDEALWRTLAAQGWLALPFSEDLGGAGGQLLEAAIVAEELARRAAILPYAETLAAGVTIAAHGYEAARAHLPAMIAGQAIVVPALLDELDSFERLAPAAPGAPFARRLFVDYGQFATGYLARVERAHQQTLDFVPAGPEVSTRPLHTTGLTPSAEVRFGALAGEPAAGPAGLRHLLLAGRALAAVQALGYAARAFEMTVEYVKNRVQFGRPIGSFQAVQHHAADMATLLQATRFLVYEAIGSFDGTGPREDQVAAAKAFASRSAVEVTALAHQLHGGIGVTEEYDLHFFSLRAKERASAWGTAGECLAVVAGSIGQPIDWLAG